MTTTKRSLILICLVVISVFGLLSVDPVIKRQVEFWLFHSVRVDGLNYHLNPDDQMISQMMVYNGNWEETEATAFVERVKEGDTVIDVGANIGFYTLLGAREVGSRGRVIAFEPDPTSFALLKQNVEESGFTNIVIEQKALSNKPGILSLYLANENKGDNRVFYSGHDRTSVEVEALALDDYLKDKNGRVDFIKIDTQGAEGIILEGMMNTIKANPGVTLAIEFWPYGLKEAGYSAERLLDVFEALNFSLNEIDEGCRGVLPITRDTLLLRYTLKNQFHTNLLLARTKD